MAGVCVIWVSTFCPLVDQHQSAQINYMPCSNTGRQEGRREKMFKPYWRDSFKRYPKRTGAYGSRQHNFITTNVLTLRASLMKMHVTLNQCMLHQSVKLGTQLLWQAFKQITLSCIWAAGQCSTVQQFVPRASTFVIRPCLKVTILTYSGPNN